MSARNNVEQNVEEFKEQKLVPITRTSMNTDDQTELDLKKKKTQIMRESIRVKQMS